MAIKKPEPSWETATQQPSNAPGDVLHLPRRNEIGDRGLLQAAVQAAAHFEPVFDPVSLSKKALELAREMEKRLQEWS